MMENRIRALLLSAGLGTRLRPLTETTPKCLVELAGKPLMAHWIEALEELGVEETLVNTHHLANKVKDFIASYRKSKMVLRLVHEPTLLGTAGTLLANIGFFKDCTGILIHADNITKVNLSCLLKAHESRRSSCILTMLTFNTKSPHACGIVEIDKNGVVVAFHEKVKSPPSNRANGAIYVFDKSFSDWIQETNKTAKDFSNEILPVLTGRIQTWHATQPYIDIGTPESLKDAQKIFK